MKYKLGLQKSLNFNLHFGNYVDLTVLPTIPDEIDWSQAVSMTKPYLNTMFGNGPDPTAPPSIRDTGAGCCFWAAAAKCLMTQSANAGDMITFTTDDVLAGYSECTGFNIATGANDNGTEPTAGFKYLQTVGLKGIKFGPPLSISPTRSDLVMAALHLGGCLMNGVKFCQEWEDAPIWNGAKHTVIGGHEIPSMKASKTKGLYIETWGETTFRLIPWPSLAQFCDQLTVCFNPDFFKNGKAPNALDYNTIVADGALVAAA